MTAYAVERERLIVAMQAEGMAPEITRRILRHANTYQRLAVVACNGDRRPYVPCPASYVPGSIAACLCDQPNGQHEKIQPVAIEQARAERLIREWCDKSSYVCGMCHGNTYLGRIGVDERRCPACNGKGLCEFIPTFQGDPRGCCVKLRVPSGRTDDGNHEGMCVPTRRY